MAHFWGLKPSEFWAASLEDKIYMTAHYEAKAEIKAVEDLILEKEIEKRNKASS